MYIFAKADDLIEHPKGGTNAQFGWCIEKLNLNESNHGPEDYRRRKSGKRIFTGT